MKPFMQALDLVVLGMCADEPYIPELPIVIDSDDHPVPVASEAFSMEATVS